MNKVVKLVAAAGILTTVGCAQVVPAPSRIAWDEADKNTHCTSDKNATTGQFIGSLAASGIGGWEIGAGLATGQFPIVGIALASVGIMGGANVDAKQAQIRECIQFKQYLEIRGKKATNKAADDSVEGRLEKISKMLKAGTITQEEYDKMRAKVLGSI